MTRTEEDRGWAKWGPAALALFYLAVVLPEAALKLVWADESITFYIAKQHGLQGIWRALASGTDPNPPLMHWMVQGSTHLLGDGWIGIRASAMLFVLVAMGSMWSMLRRWVPPLYAVAGVLAFMATRGFDYAYDARSYAPMMGLAMASLALWMWAGDLIGWRRQAALAGTALALAAGVSSNYYCVLAFFPIAAGELCRRFRPEVWVAMAAGALPLFVYLPLIRHNIAEFGPHAWNRPHVSMIGMSYVELVEGIFWPVLGLGIYLWWRQGKGTAEDAPGHAEASMPQPEKVALAVLLLYPVLGYLIARGGAGMISPRCVAPVCCGFGLAAGVLAQGAFGRSAGAGLKVVVLLVAWVVVREGFCARALLEQRRAFLTLVDEAKGAAGPILVGDSSVVLPLSFYGDPATRSRIVFPVDFAAIHQYEADDSGEQNLWAGRDGVFPFPVVALAAVDLSQRQTFTVIGRPDGWLAHSVASRSIGLQQIGDSRIWGRMGGVFTPMAHSETRLLEAVRPQQGRPTQDSR